MKIIFIVLSLFIFALNFSNANEIKIVYIDTEKILKNSIAGKKIKNELDKIAKKNIAKIKKNENQLKDEEKKNTDQQNIHSKKK